ncbi:ArgK protein [Geodermatophilus normandii]|uniref:ArgK protein n=1 Tax=Geodermatophilus normandii TaxID=1137989 RepID=A0A317QIH7_9ACTN|nr:universal stress protein [Geodermatophilus normandii]PWW22486.1 ArgK protein [Geodermatophilus normandii]
MGDSTASVPPEDRSVPPVEPVRLVPQLSRRPAPSLVVHVDGSPAAYGALVWALREAARREGTVLAVDVVDPGDGPLPGQRPAGDRARATALGRVEAQVVRAIAETGVTGRIRTATVERPVLEALTAAGRGGDLVLVAGAGRALLRHVPPRHPGRLARGA